jgi:hypothetical protein
MKQLLFLIGFLFCLTDGLLLGFTIKIVNLPADIVQKKIIWLRCCLGQGELGLLHREIVVESDNPLIQINSWRIDAQPEHLCQPLLAKMRSMYVNSFSMAVSISSHLSDEQLKNALCLTRLYLKGLLLLRNNSNRGLWYLSPLLEAVIICTAPEKPTTQLLVENTLWTPIVSWKETVSVWLDYEWVNAFVHLWQVLKDVFWVVNNILFLLIFACLLGWGMVNRRIRLGYPSLIRVMGGIFIGMTLCHLDRLIGQAGVFGAVACWLLVCTWYLLRPQSIAIFGPLTREVCTVLAACILPCLVKSILLYNGF